MLGIDFLDLPAQKQIPHETWQQRRVRGGTHNIPLWTVLRETAD